MKYLSYIVGEAGYWFDYMFGYVLTKPYKLPYYHRYMRQKYGDRYCSQELFDRYWRRITMNDHVNEE